MSKNAAQKKDEKNTSSVELATVEPVQTEHPSNSTKIDGGELDVEASLISSVRHLLREYGTRKSGAAIRDAVEMPHDLLGPKEAVSAITSLGFKASFGNMRAESFSEELLPLIAFQKNGEAIVVKSGNEDKSFNVTTHDKKNETTKISLVEFEKDFSGFVIIAKELNSREKEERSGHWFFSAFRKSKWLYVQVLIAAMVSNFLSLSVSLFTMTVYDRIIPNGAFESLMALTTFLAMSFSIPCFNPTLRNTFFPARLIS